MKTARVFVGVVGLVLLIAATRGVYGQEGQAARQPMAGPDLVILDTDIGDDIDDAFALALVLRSPELKLVGITTTFGDTELRARLVDRYLSAVRPKDIPVVPGVPTAHDNVFTQAAYARSKPYSSDAGCGHAASILFSNDVEAYYARLAEQRAHDDAVGFLLDQIRAYPGQITLIAIGPLFNIQAAIERDPAAFRKLKRVVMMGGSVYRGYDDGITGAHSPPQAEWNISRDPAGLKALLAVGVPVLMMPLDSTQVHLEAKEREATFSHGSPLTDQLTLLYHQWMANSEWHPAGPTLFDPVAVAYAVRPELCPAKPMRIEVDEKGVTRPVEGTPNAQVCLEVDEKGFLKMLEERITADSSR
jgi:inosine-uridine nucleoside N-ribohydrolase